MHDSMVGMPHARPERSQAPRPATLTLLPQAVIAFRLSGNAQRILSDALSGLVPVSFTADFDECNALLQAQHATALVVQVPRGSSLLELSMLLELRRQFPLVPMIGIYFGATSDLGAVARLGSAGVVDVLSAEPAVRPESMRAMLSRGHVESLVSKIWRLASLDVAEPVATVLRPAVRLAHGPVSLPRLAAEKRMHERSLRKYCVAHGLPSPQWIIGWARTLVVAYFLEEPGRSIQSIATLLGFSSAAIMANHLRRYAGTTASDLRRGTPLATVARLLELALTPSAHRTPHDDIFLEHEGRQLSVHVVRRR